MRRLSLAFAKAAADQLQIVKVFRQQRAVTIRAAKSLRDLSLHDSKTLRTMVGAAIVRRAGPERYFLDESVWASQRTMSTRTLWRFVIGLTLVTLVLAALLAGR